jgi:hypothetical protein
MCDLILGNGSFKENKKTPNILALFAFGASSEWSASYEKHRIESD